MENVVDLKKEKVFAKEAEAYQRIVDVIDDYAGELSLVAVLGVLDLAKDYVKGE